MSENIRKFYRTQIVDNPSGAIRSVGPLDHEVVSKVQFSVSVRDNGAPTLTAPTTAGVTVYIDDINDVPPRFLQPDYNATLMLPSQPWVSFGGCNVMVFVKWYQQNKSYPKGVRFFFFFFFFFFLRDFIFKENFIWKTSIFKTRTMLDCHKNCNTLL